MAEYWNKAVKEQKERDEGGNESISAGSVYFQAQMRRLHVEALQLGKVLPTILP